MPVPIEFGNDEFADASEHPFVRWLRHQRLLAFLWLQGTGGTFGSMVHETDAFFSVMHLQDYMRQGQWRDAVAYLSRFIQLHDYRLVSLEAQVLHRFLLAHMDLADILADTNEGRKLAVFFRQYRRPDNSTVCHGTVRLQSIMLTALHAKQHFRATFDWERVRGRAAKIAYKLVHRTPELKRPVALPAGPMKPRNVLPIRTCTGQRFRRKKLPCQPQASALAKLYLQRRGSLLSSSHSKESDNNVMISFSLRCLLLTIAYEGQLTMNVFLMADFYAKSTSWVVDILDECLQAGKLPELHQKRPLKTSGKQGATVAPSSKTTFGNLAGSAKNLVSMSVENAGSSSVTNAGKVARHVPTASTSSVTNGGKVARHVPTTGALFFGD